MGDLNHVPFAAPLFWLSPFLAALAKYAMYAYGIPMATVELSDSAMRDFGAVPLGMKLRVDAVIMRLEDWPTVSGAKPLTRELKGHYRIRTGDWRIVFHVSGDVVTVNRIDNRKDVYR